MYDINFVDECVSVFLDDNDYFYLNFDKWIYLDENRKIVYEQEFDGKWYWTNITKIIT